MELKYEYGVHCGDENCHACGTQRYNCSSLDYLDNITDMEQGNVPISKYEGGNIDIDWEAL